MRAADPAGTLDFLPSHFGREAKVVVQGRNVLEHESATPDALLSLSVHLSCGEGYSPESQPVKRREAVKVDLGGSGCYDELRVRHGQDSFFFARRRGQGLLPIGDTGPS